MGEKMGGQEILATAKRGVPEVDYLLLTGALKFQRGRVVNNKTTRSFNVIIRAGYPRFYGWDTLGTL